MKEKTIRDKLEEIRPDLHSPLFKKYYHKIHEENKGADIYDQMGLDFTLDYILSETTRQKLNTVKQEHVDNLNNDVKTQQKILDKALNFLD